MAAQPFGVSPAFPIFASSANLLRAHCPFLQVVDKHVEQDCTRYWPLWNTTSCRRPTGFCAADHSGCLRGNPFNLTCKQNRHLIVLEKCVHFPVHVPTPASTNKCLLLLLKEQKRRFCVTSEDLLLSLPFPNSRACWENPRSTRLFDTTRTYSLTYRSSQNEAFKTMEKNLKES